MKQHPTFQHSIPKGGALAEPWRKAESKPGEQGGNGSKQGVQASSVTGWQFQNLFSFSNLLFLGIHFTEFALNITII